MKSIKELFPSFSNEFIIELNKKSEIKSFKAGEIILQKGNFIRSTVLLLHGLIKIYREDDEGNEFFLYYLEPGQACALSLVCATRMEKSELTAKAVEDVDLLFSPFEEQKNWFQQFPTWYEFVVETYRNRFEEVLTVVDHIAFHHMDERLEFYLKQHFRQSKNAHITITHHQIASELNSSREVISRLLKKMEQKELIQLHRNYIELNTSFIQE